MLFLLPDGSHDFFSFVCFVESQISDWDIGSDGFELSLLDDSMRNEEDKDSNEEGSEEDEHESESSIWVYELYDTDVGAHE